VISMIVPSATSNPPKASTTNWVYTDVNRGYGQIRQAGTQLCMQLDSAAGNVVIESGCNKSATYQEWAFLSTAQFGWQFLSKWHPSGQPGAQLCLTYNQDQKNLHIGGAAGHGPGTRPLSTRPLMPRGVRRRK
jgi:hypothetical protein